MVLPVQMVRRVIRVRQATLVLLEIREILVTKETLVKWGRRVTRVRRALLAYLALRPIRARRAIRV